MEDISDNKIDSSKSGRRTGKVFAKNKSLKGGITEAKIILFTPNSLEEAIQQTNEEDSMFTLKSSLADGTPINLVVIFSADGYIEMAGHVFSALVDDGAGGVTTNDLGFAGQRWRDIYLENAPDVASDIRFKENIKPLRYGLEDLLKINPISYDRKGRKHIGFSAQELQGIIPEMVKGSGSAEADEMLSITPDYLLPVLINAVKELSAKVEKLEKPKKKNDK